ncbi:unnamed protein product [Ilex paraguariensis]|uniref:Uncharacterized protein n=1 Tax=Ilex paraguariensis TaxID=185542 RepID=A0ABC8TTF5_9AQUA
MQFHGAGIWAMEDDVGLSGTQLLGILGFLCCGNADRWISRFVVKYWLLEINNFGFVIRDFKITTNVKHVMVCAVHGRSLKSGNWLPGACFVIEDWFHLSCEVCTACSLSGKKGMDNSVWCNLLTGSFIISGKWACYLRSNSKVSHRVSFTLASCRFS